MIILNLGIYNGDVAQISFINRNELIDYVRELKVFNCIWLATNDGEDKEFLRHKIFITEEVESLIDFILSDINISLQQCDDNPNLCCHFFIQEYQTYRDAYEVALMMIEDYKKY